MVGGGFDDQLRAVSRATDAGITYLDTALGPESGLSEENLGRALGKLGAWGRAVRLDAW